MALWMMACSERGSGSPLVEKLLSWGSSGLGFDGSKVEQGRNNAFHDKFDVLEAFEPEDADVAIEEMDLVDEDNTAVGDDPEVEEVVGPNGEAGQETDDRPGCDCKDKNGGMTK
jgi:hypothetical protein